MSPERRRLLAVSAGPAEAFPAYARQTGQPCAACHTAFPELTPFGRRFKIGGYTLQGGDWQGPPLSAMYMAGFTHTKSRADPPPAPGLHTNNNLVSQQVSGFVAGKLYGNLGSFIQVTGDPRRRYRVARRVRRPLCRHVQAVRQGHDLGRRRQQLADRGGPLEHHAVLGLAADFLDRRAGFRAAPDPPRRRLHRQIVGGAGAYMFWNDMLYAEVTAYKGLPSPALQALGDGNPTTRSPTSRPTGASRSSRMGPALPDGRHVRHVRPDHSGRQYGFGWDNYLDVGFDSQYQYDGDQYSVTVKLTDILEWQRLNATYASPAHRTSTTRSTASRPTRRSCGTTPTALASAISTLPV